MVGEAFVRIQVRVSRFKWLNGQILLKAIILECVQSSPYYNPNSVVLGGRAGDFEGMRGGLLDFWVVKAQAVTPDGDYIRMLWID